MKEGPNIARIAALIGDPARANMLTALLSGKAFTATELSHEAGVTVQTASSHLSKLRDGQMVSERKQGRHKYFSLANENVAHVLESMMGLAESAGHLRTKPGPKDEKLRHARACYKHLAGNKGVQMYDSLIQQGYLQPHEDQLDLTPTGVKFMDKFGIDLYGLRKSKSPLCRNCLDWSERRTHLAGSVGRALLSQIIAHGWAEPVPSTRIISFNLDGERQFNETFRLN